MKLSGTTIDEEYLEKLNEKEILITFDTLCGKGGGERLTKVFQDMLPNAKVLAAAYYPDKTYDFDDERTISLNSWNPNPQNTYFKRAKLLYDSIKCFRKYNHNADILINVGMWSFYTPKRKSIKINYCNSPTRELYDLKQWYLRQMDWKNKMYFYGYCGVKEYFDTKFIKDTDVWIANSVNVQKRIKRYYGYNSRVLYPVSADDFYFKYLGECWLCVARYEGLKRPDLLIKAFSKMPDQGLIMAGNSMYGNYEKYKKMAEIAPNVLFVNNPDDETIRRLYSECKGTIHAAMFEDYGLTTQESFKSGKPVIVFDDSEGFAEQVNFKNGVILPEPYEKNLINTVRNWDSNNYDPKTIQKGVRDLTVNSFKAKFLEILKSEGVCNQ